MGAQCKQAFLPDLPKTLEPHIPTPEFFFGRGHNIAYMYRIAPSISFVSNRVQIASELEYTVAAYGQPDNHGIIADSEHVSNLRMKVSLFYNF